jgi:hypothetical protein
MNRVLTKSFLEINKTKIVKLFFTTSLLFSLFILFIGFIDKEPLNYKIIFVFVLVFSLGFPTLILLIAYLDWFLKKTI